MKKTLNVKVLDDALYRKKVINRLKTIEEDVLSDPGQDMLLPNNIFSKDVVQKLFCLNPSCKVDSTIDNLITSACVKSESSAGGGGEISLPLIVDMLNNAFINDGNNVREINFNDIVKEIRSKHHSFYKSNLVAALSPLKIYPEAYSIIKEVTSLQSRSTIQVERSNSTITKIKITKGSSFDVSCPHAALPSSGEWKKKNVNVFIVDGIIESVSEIHTILEKASEDNNSYLIIARSFLPDVMSTILYNIKRGTIDLIPVSTKIDENTFNIFTDLSVICGTDVVTHLKGDSISQSSKKDLKVLKSVSITENSLKIFNPDSKDKTENHIKNLYIRARNSKNEIEANMIRDRIRRMSQSTVSVSIGTHHMRSDPKIVEKIDKFLRSYMSIIKSGFVYKRDLLKIVKDKNLKNMHNVLKTLDQNIFSYDMLIKSIKISESCSKNIRSAGTIVISDI